MKFENDEIYISFPFYSKIFGWPGGGALFFFFLGAFGVGFGLYFLTDAWSSAWNPAGGCRGTFWTVPILECTFKDISELHSYHIHKQPMMNQNWLWVI